MNRTRQTDEHPLRVRSALPTDVPRLVALNEAAYPDLVEDGVVFDAAQLQAQQAVFAEGQIVVEIAGTVIGSIATLIVPSAIAMAPHTWSSVTSHGTFASHVSSSAPHQEERCLYLADVYVDPNARGRGIGAVLYDALFRLSERKRLARVVAGGRLWGYHEVAEEMTPAEYVDQVIRGERRDRVLTSQLRAGFVVRGILDGYLDDWRSHSYATHLVRETTLSRGVITSAPLARSLERS